MPITPQKSGYGESSWRLRAAQILIEQGRVHCDIGGPHSVPEHCLPALESTAPMDQRATTLKPPILSNEF